MSRGCAFHCYIKKEQVIENFYCNPLNLENTSTTARLRTGRLPTRRWFSLRERIICLPPCQRGFKLYASYLVYETPGVVLTMLNKDQTYYFAVDSFGEGGITEGTPQRCNPLMRKE